MKTIDLFNISNVKIKDLLAVCREHFGESRIRSSHHIFKMPWKGDPRINLQKQGNLAKPYQVKDVVNALKKLEKT